MTLALRTRIERALRQRGAVVSERELWAAYEVAWELVHAEREACAKAAEVQSAAAGYDCDAACFARISERIRARCGMPPCPAIVAETAG